MIEKFKTNAEVIENGDKYLYGNHVRMPSSIERGEGVYVFDKDGKMVYSHTSYLPGGEMELIQKIKTLQ
mgnify:CR=1 FL=1